ncbi:LPS-assembly protein LptD [uncultured Spongiibacter sp.]|uniref:LPS-assembly protein LptD n=1 Tax=Spongiibacter marinus TaxID=354246 RepID=UPI00048690C5|nr:LPS-assembly protein LptD [uncultured Spongiibacter sp.]MAK43891.1 LPS-assembly protein LptD [Spongiibacter sp.]
MPVFRTLILLMISSYGAASLAQGAAEQRCGPISSEQLDADISQLPAYYQHWNWLPQEYLPESVRCNMAPGCAGRFVEPARDWSGSQLSPTEAPLVVSADTIESVGDRATMSGDVQLRKGNLSLDAGYARYRRSDSSVMLRDSVVLRQPGFMLRGQSAELDTNQGLGELLEAEILSYQTGARGSAGRIARPAFDRFELEAASYTQCTPDNETWSLHAKSIELDYDSGRGVARGATVRIYDVPVFYTPYLNFPVDDRRSTGFLFPTLGFSNNSLDISTPYYLNLAPNYDLTLAPRYIETRGEALEGEFRYLNKYSEWSINGSYLPDDQTKKDDRWLLGIAEQGFMGESWYSKVDYTRVSDDSYFDDLGLANLAVKRSTHLNQKAELGYLGDNWSGHLEVQRYQTIAAVDDPYQKLPQLTLNYQSPARNFQLEPSLEFEYSRFDHRDAVSDGGNKITGQRVYGAAGVSLPMRWRWGFIEPALKSRHVAYELEDADKIGVNDNPSASSNQLSVDAGLFFERELQLADKALTQTLEPRIYYRNAEYEDQSDQPDFDSAALTFTYQQLFRDTRFTGHDRLGDADQLAIGVSSRFIDNNLGREFLSFSLGQLYYFEEGRVQLPGDPERKSSNSDIASQLRWSPSNRHSVNADLLYDARQGTLNQSNLRYHRRNDDGSVINLGYSIRREGNQFGGLENDVRQVDASIAMPLNNQWKLFAKTQYDLEDNRSVENLIGAEYQNCCWLTRIVYQQALEPDDNSRSNTSDTETNSAILVEFQLKGLGGLGTAVTSVLKESILGYQSNE